MIDNFIKYASEGVRSFLIFIMSVYNSLVGIAAGMLGQNPATWNSDGWSFVKNVNNIFLGIGGVLVAIFFLMGFCADSDDIKQDFRIENILRMFIKLSIAEFFVVNALTLVQSLFGLATGIITKIKGKGLTFEYSVPKEVTDILSDPLNHNVTGGTGAVMLVVLLILEIVFLLITVGCGAMILLEAYQRFFKILMLVPYGTLASSTIAGNHMLAHSAESFWKYALCTIMDAVTMYMALALSAVVISSGSLGLTKNQTGAMYVFAWMLESSFVCMLTLGMVKGAETVTQKALGV